MTLFKDKKEPRKKVHVMGRVIQNARKNPVMSSNLKTKQAFLFSCAYQGKS